MSSGRSWFNVYVFVSFIYIRPLNIFPTPTVAYKLRHNWDCKSLDFSALFPVDCCGAGKVSPVSWFVFTGNRLRQIRFIYLGDITRGEHGTEIKQNILIFSIDVFISLNVAGEM